VQRFAAMIMRYRVLVALLWVVITVVGALIAPQLSSRLHSGTTLNTASNTANATLQRAYGGWPRTRACSWSICPRVPPPTAPRRKRP
jgi:hypothetical protein